MKSKHATRLFEYLFQHGFTLKIDSVKLTILNFSISKINSKYIAILNIWLLRITCCKRELYVSWLYTVMLKKSFIK